jgi:hypothetical protein
MNIIIANKSLSSPLKQIKEAVAQQAAKIQNSVESLEFPFHGNWCGPNKPAKGFNPPVTDALDAACRRHDRAYERGFIKAADKQFVHEASKIPTVKAQLAAVGFKTKMLAGMSNDHSKEMVPYVPPKGKLVGVEPNPGPKNKQFGPMTKGQHLQSLRNQLAQQQRSRVKAEGVNAKKNFPKRPNLRGGGGTMNKTLNVNEFKSKVDTNVLPFDEYITDISGSTGTNLTLNGPYAINPGQAATFPLLSKEAVNWEKWKMISPLTVYYKREVTEYATAGQTGKVLLHYLADPKAPVPTSKGAVESTDYHSDGMPCEFVKLVIPASVINGDRHRLVRPGNQPGSSSISDYDGGKFFASTYGNAGTGVIGELRITGTMRFSERILESTSAQQILQDTWFGDTAYQTYTTAIQANAPVATATPVAFGQGLNALNIVNTAGSLVPPAGNYRIHATLQANAATYFTQVSCVLCKNGTVLTPGAYNDFASAATINYANTTDHAIVSCNGTDAITLAVTLYGQGALVAKANMFFTAC